MSERLRQAFAQIIAFIRKLSKTDKQVRPTPYYIDAFKRDAAEEEKRNSRFVDNFCEFYEEMEKHLRGTNIYGSGVDKYDMPKGDRSGGYRVLTFFDKPKNEIVFIAVYPKDDEKRVLTKKAIRNLKSLVKSLKHRSVPITSLAEEPPA